WIDIEEKRVFDAQNSWGHQAVGGEPHDLVGAVCVVIDQMFHDRNWTADVIGGNHESGQCVSGDFLVLGLNFSPSNLVVAIGLEPDCIVEVAQCDVPLPTSVIALCRKREVAVARLVGMRGGNPHRQQQNQKEKPHRWLALRSFSDGFAALFVASYWVMASAV